MFAIQGEIMQSSARKTDKGKSLTRNRFAMNSAVTGWSGTDARVSLSEETKGLKCQWEKKP